MEANVEEGWLHTCGASQHVDSPCGVECLPVLPTHLTLMCPGIPGHNRDSPDVMGDLCSSTFPITKAVVQEKEEGLED